MTLRELTEARKAKASMDSLNQEAVLSAEMAVREELRIALEEAQQQARDEQQALVIKVKIFTFWKPSVKIIAKQASPNVIVYCVL